MADPARPTLEEWSIERLERELPIASDAPVAIESAVGDVRIRRRTDGVVRAFAVAQRHRDDPRAPVLELVVRDGAVHVTPGFAVGDPARAEPSAWARRRIDLVVELPPTGALVVRASAGLVESRGGSGAIEISTRHHPIAIRGAGAVVATSESGSIEALFHPSLPTSPSRFESRTGAISIGIPAGSRASIELVSQVAFATDFSLEVERVGAVTRRATARIGGGGVAMAARSERGEIRLFELPALETMPEQVESPD